MRLLLARFDKIHETNTTRTIVVKLLHTSVSDTGNVCSNQEGCDCVTPSGRWVWYIGLARATSVSENEVWAIELVPRTNQNKMKSDHFDPMEKLPTYR